MHAHLAGDVGQDFMAVLEFNSKHCIGERFNDLPLQDDRIFLGLRQGGTPWSQDRVASCGRGWVLEAPRQGRGGQQKVSVTPYSVGEGRPISPWVGGPERVGTSPVGVDNLAQAFEHLGLRALPIDLNKLADGGEPAHGGHGFGLVVL